MNKLLLSLLLLCTCGCSYFDPLHIMPRPSPTVPASSWEDKAPDKQAYANVYKVWTTQADKKQAAELALNYYGLFDAMAAEIADNKGITTGQQVFDLLSNSRAKLAIAAGSCADFSTCSENHLIAAGLENGDDQLTDSTDGDPGTRQKASDAFKSIACGCAGAYSKLHRGAK